MNQSGRIAERFERNRQTGKAGLLPYFTSGYPDAKTTELLVREADSRGATVIELGEPYSDSIADGPVIQESFNAALEAGHRVRDTFDLLARVRSDVECAVVAMTSYSIVHRFGLREYMNAARQSGFDGLILPDVPAEESQVAFEAAAGAGLDYIALIPPTTTANRRQSALRLCTGFIYQIAEAGTTGERSQVAASLPSQVAAVRAHTSLPICVGFGISSAAHVREVCRHADGAIVGSAIIRRIQEQIRGGARESGLTAALGAFLGQLMAGVERS